MTDEEVIRTVKVRYRVCNYLFRLGIIGFVVGAVLGNLSLPMDKWIPDGIAIAGAAVFLSAFAVTLALYRCPVCDRYLSRFRPRKDQCPQCGAKIR